MKPKKDPSDKSEPQRANEVVLDFINSVVRSQSSDLPELVNRYYDAIRDEHTDEPFTEYDFKTAIMRWYDGCPNASAFYNDHATGPISW